MLDIIAALAIPDLIHNPVKVTKVQANYYNDIHQQRCPEIIMNLKFPVPLPADITCSANSCYFIGSDNEGKLRVTYLRRGKMKYFYSNYKDYYYLPQEDIAIHKSVAGFVDKEFRQQALASTTAIRAKSLPIFRNGIRYLLHSSNVNTKITTCSLS